ncbi:MAG: ATP-binding cassette domain-containing protein [candidate division Zixibacteria bacterium]|nr:ATP-binding cassette domain-containing protein [candidate division Zixibacteria bacterium]
MRLKVEEIHKEFDGKVAVDRLSLEVPEGVIFGIIGPNGAGKTTTIRMIMDITAPDSGHIYIDGRKADQEFKNRVGYLPEERGLYKKMTLSEVMIYMAELKSYPRNKARDKIDYWLKKVDLLEYRGKKVEELSKGMQQKLQFVTTVLHEPDLLILDEIFSGLDPLNMELIKDILMELKREGKTILFSTHVMEQAEKLCDHICMISRGQKVLDGRLTDVKARFGKNSVQIDIDGDGKFASELPGVRNLSEFNNYIELQLEQDADTNAILKSIADRVQVRRFELMEPSLYDIFIDRARIDPADLTQAEGGGAHV